MDAPSAPGVSLEFALRSIDTFARIARFPCAARNMRIPSSSSGHLLFEDIAYHDYEGVAEDESESDRMARNLGPMNQMILRNHGVITVGKTVGEAFWRMYHLEMACGAQIDILATGREVTLPSPETCRKVRQQYEKDFIPANTNGRRSSAVWIGSRRTTPIDRIRRPVPLSEALHICRKLVPR